MYKFHYKTPIGTICIEDEDNNIVGLYLDNSDPKDDIETELIKKAHSARLSQSELQHELPFSLHPLPSSCGTLPSSAAYPYRVQQKSAQQK